MDITNNNAIVVISAFGVVMLTWLAQEVISRFFIESIIVRIGIEGKRCPLLLRLVIGGAMFLAIASLFREALSLVSPPVITIVTPPIVHPTANPTNIAREAFTITPADSTDIIEGSSFATIAPTSTLSLSLGIDQGCIDSTIWKIPNSARAQTQGSCLTRAEQCHFQPLGKGLLLFRREQELPFAEECMLYREASLLFLQRLKFVLNLKTASSVGALNYVEIGLLDVRPVHEDDVIRPVAAVRGSWGLVGSASAPPTVLVVDLNQNSRIEGQIQTTKNGLFFEIQKENGEKSTGTSFVLNNLSYLYIKYKLSPRVEVFLNLFIDLGGDQQ